MQHIGLFHGTSGVSTKDGYKANHAIALRSARVMSVAGHHAVVLFRDGTTLKIKDDRGRMIGSEGGYALYDNKTMKVFPEPDKYVLVEASRDGKVIVRDHRWTDFGIASAIHRLEKVENVHEVPEDGLPEEAAEHIGGRASINHLMMLIGEGMISEETVDELWEREGNGLLQREVRTALVAAGLFPKHIRTN